MDRACNGKGMERTYRKRVTASGLVSFQVTVKETDLWISAGQNLEKQARDLVFRCRHWIERYIDLHPGFMSTLSPYPEDPFAPEIVREMVKATADIGVGPMAAVAGAVAQFVGRGLMKTTEQVIVENGGDIYLKTDRSATVCIFAGTSPLSEKLGLVIPMRQMPLGICTSSGTLGHSLSMGSADVVCLLSSSALRADGAATALCNGIHNRKDLERVAERASRIKGIEGGVAIMGDAMTSWGDVELTVL
ncbi:MAG: UPF0280 family protein [Desulfatiglandales bacterium]